MKSSLPEPDTSISPEVYPIMLLHIPLMRPKPLVSQVASTIERMWSVGLDEVPSTSKRCVYALEFPPFPV